jgi:hypothetical protein
VRVDRGFRVKYCKIAVQMNSLAKAKFIGWASCVNLFDAGTPRHDSGLPRDRRQVPRLTGRAADRRRFFVRLYLALAASGA